VSAVPIKYRKLIVKYASAILKVNLQQLSYENIGIFKYQNFSISGEEFLLQKVLPAVVHEKKITAFDIGANEGDYAIQIQKQYSEGQIFCFEPIMQTFEALCEKTTKYKNIRCFNIGLGEKKDTFEIFTYKNKLNNKHASLYKEVITDIHNSKEDCIAYSVQIDTLSDFCEEHRIKVIDFLKIDTEGSEFSVLKGGISLIEERRIKVIQFEFGEMNVVSRVFLKDFYNILGEYNIYRLDTNRLIPLYQYNAWNEIFLYQNFVAIRKDLDKFFEDESRA
jgi:FkbM family methyltransferase